MAGWEHFEHQADIGVRGWGSAPAEAFEQAAIALVAVSVAPAAVAPRERIEVHCEAPDLELLLADWMNVLIREMSARRMVFSRFSVRIAGLKLRAEAWGEPLEPERHRPAVEVKGASFLGLKVGRDDAGRWVAQCVVDV
jgi:SHS2 domain-containing protein